MNEDIYGTEDTALEAYDSCYCGELVEGETCVCCESCILILDSDQKFAVKEERSEVRRQLEQTPEDCQWFDYPLVSGEEISIDRGRIVVVQGWGEMQ